MITTDFDDMDRPVLTRGTGVTTSDSVSYAVVEFVGSNWTIQREEHIFDAGATQTVTITTPVNSIARTFLHIQQRNDIGTANDNLCDTGAEVQLTGTSTITWLLI